jgi:hypothetical protein
VIVEAVITFIIVAALFYVAPGVLGAIKVASPVVCGDLTCINASPGRVLDAGLNASQLSMSTTIAGGLNLSTISMIMMGIAIMIGGFMMVRGGGNQ